MAKSSANTQDLVEIEEIKGSTILLKSGKICEIIIVGGINFALKSDAEQDVIIHSYQNFVNSLNFPVQILIHSRKINISKYLKTLEERRAQETSGLLQDQIAEYKDFVERFVSENAIMSKTFLVVVSFSPALLKPSSFLPPLPFKKASAEPADKTPEAEFGEAKKQLEQRVNQVMQGLANIGLEAAVLDNEQLLELFYNFYNPETVEKEGLPAKK